MNPIFFNAGKHHFYEMAEKLIQHVENDTKEDDLVSIVKGLDGVTDIYVGTLSGKEIEQEILQSLKENGVTDSASYREFLEREGEIKKMGYYVQHTLSDESIFTLRFIEDEKYIHAHPARYSPNTFRIRGNTLKTIIVSVFISIRDGKCIMDLGAVNSARKKLDLSPLVELPSKLEAMLIRVKNNVEKCNKARA